eukprot:4518418-Prymnesium_polylepis.1
MRIRTVVVATGVVATLAGSGAAGSADGTGIATSFSAPHELAASPDGASVFVVDWSANNIRQRR